MLLLLSLLACSEEKSETENTENTENIDDSKDWEAAALAELSSDSCPNMSQSGELVSFTSSGEERNVVIIFPDELTEDMRVVFFFHGLMPENSNPAKQTASGLQLQSFANSYNSIIILPESPVWDLMGQRFHLWDIEDGTYDNDLVLFDDLRTCVANAFTVDLDKVVSAGFSGGSLFNTILISHRSDTLAAVVEFSGGADLSIPLFENKFAPYSTPVQDIPVLLVSGGENDIWPDPTFTLVDFAAGTDTLQENLLLDEQVVVRCRHDQGHTITNATFEAGLDWLVNHEFGQPSPYASELGDWTADCEIP